MAGKLNSYLADIDKRARFLFDKTVKSLAEKENVTEKLKSGNAILWVQKMNTIRNRATEIVNNQKRNESSELTHWIRLQ